MNSDEVSPFVIVSDIVVAFVCLGCMIGWSISEKYERSLLALEALTRLRVERCRWETARWRTYVPDFIEERSNALLNCVPVRCRS